MAQTPHAIGIAGACAPAAVGAALERGRGPCTIVGGAVCAFALARLKEELARQCEVIYQVGRRWCRPVGGGKATTLLVF